MTIFGSDPDTPSSVWLEHPAPKSRPRRQVNDLINYFGYHKMMRMSQRFDDKDRAVLASFFSKRLSSGFTSSSLRRMVDIFYGSHYNNSDFPALTFCKKEVQEQLVLEVDLVNKDPYIQWLADGMPDDGPFTDSKEMRKAVLLYADDSLYRYPEVVADILRLDYSGSKTSDLLSDLNSVICWCLGDSVTVDVSELARLVSLPEELNGTTRRKNSIRSKSDTFLQAVARIPKKREDKW